MKVSISIRLREMTELDAVTGCWIWKWSRRSGYAQIHANGRKHYAHRVSYETFNGPIPEGLEIDHLCARPLCVNPDHLEAVTSAENSRRALVRRLGQKVAEGVKLGGGKLTPRQAQIVAELSNGQTQDSLAKALGLSLQTVKNHLLTARRVTGARSTIELVAWLSSK